MPIEVPTSTVASLISTVGSQLGDTGTLAVLVFAAGVPFAFWFIHKLIGLIPKTGGKRRD